MVHCYGGVYVKIGVVIEKWACRRKTIPLSRFLGPRLLSLSLSFTTRFLAICMLFSCFLGFAFLQSPSFFAISCLCACLQLASLISCLISYLIVCFLICKRCCEKLAWIFPLLLAFLFPTTLHSCFRHCSNSCNILA